MVIAYSRRVLLGMIGAMPLATRALGADRGIAPHILQLPVPGGRTSRITLWRAKTRRGTILFSHGALSSPAKYDPLILPWVAAGYDVWAPLHVDSTDHPDTKAFPGLASWRARMEDMHALANHLGGTGYIAAGHSYGALVALTLGGVKSVLPEGMAHPLADPRVKAAVAFSPPGITPELVDKAAYAGLAVPSFITTGTRDLPPVRPGAPADPDAWRGHLLAYDSAPAGGNRYALVQDGVDHYFGGLICRPDLPGPAQWTQLAEAVRLSTLFLHAYGAGSRMALAVLDGRLMESGPVVLRKK